jgi:hypothetical protein
VIDPKQRNIVGSVIAALLRHPLVRAVELAGSRAAGSPTVLSDWDFRVRVDDFAAVAADLPALVATLEPLAQQWDRLNPESCYMLMLAGPAKIDLIFDQPHQDEALWTVTAETLPRIDEHFWDWILWIASKQLAGKDHLVRSELGKMSRHLLGPMGVEGVPRSIRAAVRQYRGARDRWESRLGVAVPRRLEVEVEPALSHS